MKKPQKLLRDIFGFDEFRLGQREIIDAVSSKKMCLLLCQLGEENRYVFNCRHS